MSKLAELKGAQTREDVAKLLLTSPSGLNAILYSQKIETRYTTFTIPKKRGGTRIIKAPDEKLKLLQKKLSVLLQDCQKEIEVGRGANKQVAHGFKRECSIYSNAQEHRNRRWVFNLDLCDFFPSINFGRVRGLFMKDRNFLLSQDVATVLAQIACDGKVLPQGSPCSPVISNLVAHILDMHIVRVAAKVGCTYTRYADDLTFSTNKKAFPEEIALQAAADSSIWKPGKKLTEIITHAGFNVNEKKTRMRFRDSRQDVTGLITNKKVNVPSEYRQTVRAMVHRLFRTGAFQLTGYVKVNGASQLGVRDGSLNELHGRLGFIDEIDQRNQKTLPKQTNTAPLHTAKKSMYRQFLIYKDFYTATTPVIICEGKTDNVYLKHAIRSLAPAFPKLASVDASGKITLKIRLYRYTRTSTGRVLGLKDGGSGDLGNFIGSYKKDIERFAAPGLANPVIILFDSDNGAGSICGAAKKAHRLSKSVLYSDPFTQVVKNLYLVSTPIPQGQTQSQIEDFFDAMTKNMTLSGRTFMPTNDPDKTQFYGKAEFAEKVVAAHAATIDFSGFTPLLARVVAAIDDYASHISAPSSATPALPAP